jgi:hypothetical protein
MHMQEKPVGVSVEKHLMRFPSDESCQASLLLDFEKEVDRLALLLEEVKKQSARVQAAADAIGDRLVVPELGIVVSHSDGRAAVKPGARK